MSESAVSKALRKLYGQWAGELQWLEAPPKTMGRTSRNRDAFRSAAAERAARVDEIKRGLPHIAYVIKVYEPDWSPEMARPIRPKAKWGAAPPGGWVGGAFEALREADDFLTIAEIVEVLAERYDLDVSSVQSSQKAHTSVNNALAHHRDRLISDEKRPAGWAIKSKIG